MYLLGFVCALAISRVKVSSIVVFPACFLVFAVGFSIGIVNGAHMSDLSLIGAKKRPKDDNYGGVIEKLRSLVNLFNGFDVKTLNLKNDIKRGIKTNQITASDLESYVKVIESIGFSALNGKTVVEGCIESILIDNQEVSRSSNQKSSKRKKEGDGMGFDFLQFVENSIGSKANKVKDSVKKDMTHMEAKDHRENILAPSVEERMSKSLYNESIGYGNAEFPRDTYDNNIRFLERAEEKQFSENGKLNFMETESGAKRVFDSEEYNLQNNRVRFKENGQISLNMAQRNSVETWASQNDLLDLDFSVSLKHKRTEASFAKEENFVKVNENHVPSDHVDRTEKVNYGSRMRDQQVISENGPSVANHPSPDEGEFASFASSMVSDDVIFNKYLMEANLLLKQARESLWQRGNEGDAENALYKSARLLSKALDMKPMSLLAVGQLGNTYLLHGELKLKISRKLRAVLATRDPLSAERAKVIEGLGAHVDNKEKVANFLINVCEECEELLVKAGRKYRLALSIDGNDMRALYNWGLALSFRAQLIADIGPEAAFDADKVYLAAIDKFDAMMSKSNDHAPDALYRWGVALQQRSRLRTRNNKEKVKLLNQAKRLYEDALDMGSSNPQVRDALSSCISELNYRNY